MEKRIALGSGKLYVAEPTEALDLSDLDAFIAKWCTAENEFAAVKNGGTITYSPTSYTATCDLGRFTKTVTQDETVTLAAGLCTVGGDVLQVLVDTGRVEEKTGGQVVKIGGVENAKNASYLVIFEHIDAADGNIYAIVMGKNTAELSLSFAPGSETILNPTFTAEGLDDAGTKLIVYFKKPKGAAE